MRFTLSSKGQLVIPPRLRQLLGLQPGDRLALSLEADRLRWIPGAAPELGADGSGIFRRSMSLPVALHTNVLVRQLDEVVKEARRRHGRSMEEEARLILAQAVAAEEAISLSSVGLGSGMAALFSGATLEEPFGVWRGVAAVAAQFET